MTSGGSGKSGNEILGPKQDGANARYDVQRVRCSAPQFLRQLSATFASCKAAKLRPNTRDLYQINASTAT